MTEEKQEPPLIVQYTDLLHQHRDPNAEPVKAFIEAHKDDEVFVARAQTLNRILRLKSDRGDDGVGFAR